MHCTHPQRRFNLRQSHSRQITLSAHLQHPNIHRLTEINGCPQIDYSSFLSKNWPSMSSHDFVSMVSSPHVLGNPLLKTQHLIGLSTWSRSPADGNEDEIILGTHQMRVAHQRYTDMSMTEVKVKGHAHGTGVMTYKKMKGEWKFAGVCPQVGWGEFDYDRVFADGEEEFGKEKKAMDGNESGTNGAILPETKATKPFLAKSAEISPNLTEGM